VKAKLLIALLQQELDTIAADGGDPEVVEVCLYCPEENLHSDWWEITGLSWEYGDPNYIEIAGIPQTE
jgi:hypothetical protein